MKQSETELIRIMQEKSAGGLVNVNFGSALSEAVQEIRLWTSLDYAIPVSARNMEIEDDQLKLLRSKATVLAAHYNKVRTHILKPAVQYNLVK